jgi:hypothetical protein
VLLSAYACIFSVGASSLPVCPTYILLLACSPPPLLHRSKGAGSACLLKPQRMEQIVRSMSSLLSCPLTFKMRKVRGCPEFECCYEVWAVGWVLV